MSIRERISLHILHKIEEQDRPWARRLQLQALLWLTASAFDHKGEWILGKSSEETLEGYALFTKKCMAELKNASPENRRKGKVSPRRLYEKFYRMGRFLRCISGLRREEDQKRLVFFLYRQIGIILEGKLPGEITVKRCYFSQHYRPWECRLIAAMDRGIICGIFGGGKLEFSQRMTEKNCQVCKACLDVKRKS